jgi:hypothetical protein
MKLLELLELIGIVVLTFTMIIGSALVIVYALGKLLGV